MKLNAITNRHLFFLFLIPVFYLPCYISNEMLIAATTEDAIIENIGAVFFLLTSIICFLLAAKPDVFLSENIKDKNKKRYYFLVLGILFFFAFGEEISWGQRIFNYETPESMREMNAQGEFNIHNIKIFHGRGEDGEEKTGLASLITINRLFYMAFFIYLLVVPLFYKLNSKFRALMDKIYLPVPSIVFGILFCVNWIYANSLIAIYTNRKSHGIVEIKETVFAFIIFAMALYWIKFKTAKKVI